MKSESGTGVTAATPIAKSFLATVSCVLSRLVLVVPVVVTTQSAHAHTYKVLYSFQGGVDGGAPQEDFLLRDSNGNLYGTTTGYGKYGYGVIFKLSKDGTETPLYSFSNGTDGGNPYSGLVMDDVGNLYGTTCCGGGYGAGVVFRLDTNGQESSFYTFTGGNDGGYPYYGLVRTNKGEFYGTATAGGAYQLGAVFRLNSKGQETPIYSFTGDTDGTIPVGVLVRVAGAFYGVTEQGGGRNHCNVGFLTDCGVVFKVTPAGAETVLYTFSGGGDGGNPFAGLIRDPAGNLYGTTQYGGATGCYGNGCGVVFKLDTNNVETVLHTFSGGVDGANPYGTLIRDPAGNLYGTTYNGGNLGHGVVFKLDTNNTETLLYTFAGGADGAYPRGSLLRTRSGDLYGTTVGGGLPNCGYGNGCGVVFKITP